jgi:hypothetical protein
MHGQLCNTLRESYLSIHDEVIISNATKAAYLYRSVRTFALCARPRVGGVQASGVPTNEEAMQSTKNAASWDRSTMQKPFRGR